MAKTLLPDALWAEIAPLFPLAAPRPKGGRPRVGDREALIGVLFVLYTAIPWEQLPFEVAGCSVMTCCAACGPGRTPAYGTRSIATCRSA